MNNYFILFIVGIVLFSACESKNEKELSIREGLIGNNNWKEYSDEKFTLLYPKTWAIRDNSIFNSKVFCSDSNNLEKGYCVEIKAFPKVYKIVTNQSHDEHITNFIASMEKPANVEIFGKVKLLKKEKIQLASLNGYKLRLHYEKADVYRLYNSFDGENNEYVINLYGPQELEQLGDSILNTIQFKD